MSTTEQSATVQRDDLELLERVVEVSEAMRREVAKRIVGQDEVIDELLTALLANGHALLVGVPGLAKTLLVQTCLLYTSPSPRDKRQSRMPSSA